MTTTSAASPAIAVTGLQKSFGDKVVLDGIDLTVQEGTIFALLGPNGVGKTTTVHILSTLIPADGGDAQVAGYDLVREADSVRAAIGVTGQFSAVDNLLTGEENLLLMADLHHLGRPRDDGGPPCCSASSNWPKPPGSRPPPTRAACCAGSTSP
jgi:ABC-2 type transport system ATP-binding protein